MASRDSLHRSVYRGPLAGYDVWQDCPTGPARGKRPRSSRTFFQTQTTRVLVCIFLQTGATICLGLFSAVVVSRLQFLGVHAAGATIALFGGFLCVFDSMAASFATWTLIRPGGLRESAHPRHSQLPVLRVWRSRILDSHGPADGWRIRLCRTQETHPSLGHDSRSISCRVR